MKTLLLSTFLVGAAVIGAAAPLCAEDTAMLTWTDPGNRFSLVQPEGWRIDGSGSLVRLASPEGDIALWFGLSEAADPAEAVATAWAAVGQAVPAPQTVAPAPPRDGFEAATVFVYPPDGDTIRQAIVESREGRLHVTLIRGTLAAFDRRGAQVNIAVTGFRPAGAAVDRAGVMPDALDAADLEEFGAYVAEILARFDVPGAVVAVVQGGEVRMLRGFGVRTIGTNDVVTPDTRMMIGSVGKSMTTLLMARLVEDGRLSWDQPVHQILSGFTVADPELSGTITVQNLVCACSGVPRRDMEFLFNAEHLDAEAVIGSLAGFAFFTGFGEAFQYSNQLVATGGWVAAAADGAEWGALDAGYARLLEERLFAPLGMTRSTLDFAEVMADADTAHPHAPMARAHGPPLRWRPKAPCCRSPRPVRTGPPGPTWRAICRRCWPSAGGMASFRPAASPTLPPRRCRSARPCPMASAGSSRTGAASV